LPSRSPDDNIHGCFPADTSVKKVQKCIGLGKQGVLVKALKAHDALKTTTAAPQFYEEEFQSRFGRLANQTFRTNSDWRINNTFSGLVSGIGVACWVGGTWLLTRNSVSAFLPLTPPDGNFLALIATLIGFVDGLHGLKLLSAPYRSHRLHAGKSETCQKPFANISWQC